MRPTDITDLMRRLGLERPPADWVDQANCRNLTPAEADTWFYPRAGVSPEAVAYCDRCPVWEACLAAEVVEVMGTGDHTRPVPELQGVRAGMGAAERQRLARGALARMDGAAQLAAHLDSAGDRITA